MKRQRNWKIRLIYIVAEHYYASPEFFMNNAEKKGSSNQKL